MSPGKSPSLHRSGLENDVAGVALAMSSLFYGNFCAVLNLFWIIARRYASRG